MKDVEKQTTKDDRHSVDAESSSNEEVIEYEPVETYLDNKEDQLSNANSLNGFD